MASLTFQSLLLAGAYITLTTAAQIDTQLVGTWSTKSGKVLTGPGFYNPINDSFIEPSHTGISYSFTADGFYETAYYRAIANPTNPECAQGLIQWQHGTVVMNDDLSLTLTPFGVDGRQLQSDPCSELKKSTYTRYIQSETIKKWQVYVDPYTKLTRVDLYRFDGSPMHPMFQAFNPPQMLPTITMNPTTAAPSATGNAKRDAGHRYDLPLNKNVLKRDATSTPLVHRIDLNMLWWAGVGMTIFGGAAYLM
ncbi:chaperone for protein-folding within the ER, fungal-domain-containing protein [Bisporella sp. PMI_857]|nr:chaperone for protein-folding within the ER, fungal-domain-containing protein [Bisporella sp. PMI_857]